MQTGKPSHKKIKLLKFSQLVNDPKFPAMTCCGLFYYITRLPFPTEPSLDTRTFRKVGYITFLLSETFKTLSVQFNWFKFSFITSGCYFSMTPLYELSPSLRGLPSGVSNSFGYFRDLRPFSCSCQKLFVSVLFYMSKLNVLTNYGNHSLEIESTSSFEPSLLKIHMNLDLYLSHINIINTPPQHTHRVTPRFPKATDFPQS